MLLLTATNQTLSVITGAAASIDITVSYVDITNSSFDPGVQDTNISTATTTTICSAPAASTQRQIKSLLIRNRNASTTNTVTLTKVNGISTYYVTPDIALPPNNSIQYIDGKGFNLISSDGSIKVSPVNAAGTSGAVLYNSNYAVAGSTQVDIESDGNLSMASQGTGTPTTPATNTLKLFNCSVSGRNMLAQVGPSGLDTAFQPFMARNKIGYWNPPGNSNTVPGVFGITAPTTAGTATSRNVATTSLAARMRRLGYVSAATAGAFAYQYLNIAQFTCGSGANDGSGFMLVFRFVPSNAANVTGERFYVGMGTNTAAPTNVEPNTLTNHIGLAQLSTDNTQFYLVYGGSSAQTNIALGTGFGAPSPLSTVAYEFAIFCPAGIANTYYIQATNLTTDAVYSTTIVANGVNLPTSGSLQASRIWKTNNATLLAVGYDLCSMYIETDY